METPQEVLQAVESAYNRLVKRRDAIMSVIMHSANPDILRRLHDTKNELNEVAQLMAVKYCLDKPDLVEEVRERIQALGSGIIDDRRRDVEYKF